MQSARRLPNTCLERPPGTLVSSTPHTFLGSNRQQSSDDQGTGTPVSQAGVACVPSDRLPLAPYRSDDCSRLDLSERRTKNEEQRTTTEEQRTRNGTKNDGPCTFIVRSVLLKALFSSVARSWFIVRSPPAVCGFVVRWSFRSLVLCPSFVRSSVLRSSFFVRFFVLRSLFFVLQPFHLRLERPPAIRIVDEHVEARTRWRQ